MTKWEVFKDHLKSHFYFIKYEEELGFNGTIIDNDEST
jgi:hypothetical protein